MEQIIDILGEPEILAQLAEEASELAQAALKLRRAINGRNPTPKTEEECRVALLEEVADVELCLEVLGFQSSSTLTDIGCIMYGKKKRWIERLADNAQITPPVDTVPVVRCKDCKQYGYDALGYKICNADVGLARPDDDDYCSCGQSEDQSAGLRNASETDS